MLSTTRVVGNHVDVCCGKPILVKASALIKILSFCGLSLASIATLTHLGSMLDMLDSESLVKLERLRTF